jgi:hypothetical protein
MKKLYKCVNFILTVPVFYLYLKLMLSTTPSDGDYSFVFTSRDVHCAISVRMLALDD